MLPERSRTLDASQPRGIALKSGVAVRLLLVLALPAAAQGPSAETIGPDLRHDTIQGRSSSSGSMVALAGDERTLYGVSLNAGVWKMSVRSPWKQLRNSPRYAATIAIEPGRRSHVVVGERSGDASPLALERCGVWESTDSGETWDFAFDPLVYGEAQVVPAILYAPSKTLFVGTLAGIARRPAGASEFEFRSGGPVRALAASRDEATGKDLVWAKIGNGLLVTEDDGETWTGAPIPPVVDGYGTTGASRGDSFSLCAAGRTALLLCVPDGNTEKSKLDAIGNRNGVLYRHPDGRWSFQVLDTGNGTGIGGRRFLRAFRLPRGGGRIELRVYLVAGQDVMEARRMDAEGRFEWTRILLTECGEAGADPVHPDLWDLLASSDGETVWVGSSGGVHVREDGRWKMRNEGLRTHHVHGLTVLGGGRIVYVTAGNSEWWCSGPDRPWRSGALLGDANWTAGDFASSALALVVRNDLRAHLVDFEGLGGREIRLGDGDGLRGNLTFRILQTVPGEGAPAHLDAVTLESAGGKLRLIRNRAWDSNPSWDERRLEEWKIELADLPGAPRGLLVAGGHARPRYWYLADEGGRLVLLRHEGESWKRLDPGELVPSSSYGPVFVDPYHPANLIALTTTGVRVSADGGDSFSEDRVLTGLLTASGKYPIVGSYPGGAGEGVVVASAANPMATLAHVAYLADRRPARVVASPFTGVFFSGEDGVWRNLSSCLPAPFTPVSAVGIDDEFVYAATEGRGLIRIRNYRRAPVATYVEQGTLRAADGHPVAGKKVRLAVSGEERIVETGPAGEIPLEGVVAGSVVFVAFDGAPGLAPFVTSWLAE